MIKYLPRTLKIFILKLLKVAPNNHSVAYIESCWYLTIDQMFILTSSWATYNYLRQYLVYCIHALPRAQIILVNWKTTTLYWKISVAHHIYNSGQSWQQTKGFLSTNWVSLECWFQKNKTRIVLNKFICVECLVYNT